MFLFKRKKKKVKPSSPEFERLKQLNKNLEKAIAKKTIDELATKKTEIDYCARSLSPFFAVDYIDMPIKQNSIKYFNNSCIAGITELSLYVPIDATHTEDKDEVISIRFTISNKINVHLSRAAKVGTQIELDEYSNPEFNFSFIQARIKQYLSSTINKDYLGTKDAVFIQYLFYLLKLCIENTQRNILKQLEELEQRFNDKK